MYVTWMGGTYAAPGAVCLQHDAFIGQLTNDLNVFLRFKGTPIDANVEAGCECQYALRLLQAASKTVHYTASTSLQFLSIALQYSHKVLMCVSHVQKERQAKLFGQTQLLLEVL